MISDVPIGHLGIFFGEMFIQVLCSVLNQVLGLLLSSRSFLYSRAGLILMSSVLLPATFEDTMHGSLC
jgi:hypothetical protein